DNEKCISEVGFSSRHRKAQGIAAAGHVDGGKAGGGKAAAGAVALLVGFEFALARAELGGAAPVQRLVLEPAGAVVGIDCLGNAACVFGPSTPSIGAAS